MLGAWLNRRAAELRHRHIDLMTWEIFVQRTLDSRLSYRIRLILCGASALLAASHAATASADTTAADTSSDTLEEVTVTAQRRVENVRDVPISLTVFSGDAITQQNFQGV